ncbi:LVIVD repeat-containing protein [Planctomycetota bacterium]
MVAVVVLLGAFAPVAWASTANVAPDDEHDRSLPFTEEELVTHVFSLAQKYFADFRHPKTHVLYGARLSSKHRWTSPDDVKAEKPAPWGYGSRIADTSLHGGHMLVALLDAHEARPDPFLKENVEKTFRALKLIGSLPETHPKPDKPALVGLVPRGPHPDDMTAYYDDSSMDQHTTYIVSLARYANSSLATEEDKAWIRQSLEKVGRRLEKNGWSIMRADGQTRAHVGFSWTGYNSQHASILLPTVYALYRGTGNTHWLTTFETLIRENDGARWSMFHPGPHVKIGGHPIYANQGAFRLNSLYHLDANPERKAVVRDLLRYTTELQLARPFPGPMYQKFHSDEAWRRLRRKWNWSDDELHGSEAAWDRFQPTMLDDSLAVLAHVRFPLTGFHMVLLSEHPEMIRAHLARIWEMLNTVDLEKVTAGETNYLLTVASLHVYAFHFRSHGQLEAKTESASHANETDASETFLPIVGDVGIGPTIDVTVDGDLAFAIGRGVLRVLDISQPLKPQVLGQLSGLGNTRQLVTRQGIVYVGSREDGVFVIDATDPAQPRLLTRYDSVEFATGVGISGDVLFLACRHYGVEIVDVSTPDKPIHLSTVCTGEAQSVSIRNGFLYAGVWATSEVVVVDVRNPRRPQITARVVGSKNCDELQMAMVAGLRPTCFAWISADLSRTTPP